MEKTELRPACVFTCEKCGNDVFGTLIVVEFAQCSKEEQDELRHCHGEYAETCALMRLPKIVTCKECNITYEAEGFER